MTDPPEYAPQDRQRWDSTWRAVGASSGDVAAHRDLIARYAEPARRYHTMQHLSECFSHWDAVRDQATHPGEVELALWFHDAVYDPHRDDNEVKSAALSRAAIVQASLPASLADGVSVLILATAHQSPPEPGDTALLVDVDLAILAAPRERFDEYERQVREEYAWVPAPLFERKRRDVLERFLARPSIYSSPHFQRVAEGPARENLRRSLVRLALSD